MVSANPVLSTWFSLLLLERDMLERGKAKLGFSHLILWKAVNHFSC